jgi:multidrug efflux pump
LTSVFSIVILLFGLVGFYYLGVREYPNATKPVVTVVTNYTGANADVIESQITEPLEEEINAVSGIKSMKSISRDGRSTIKVEFNLDKNLQDAANDVRARVSRALQRLPPDADNPSVIKSDADASPIVFLNIKSGERNLLELTDIADNVFKEQFQTITGVSEVQIWGDKTYAMRLWLDPAKLKAFKLTPLDVSRAINEANVELPTGSVDGNDISMTVKTKARLQREQEFNRVVIAKRNGRLIRFEDVGYAELGPRNVRTILKRDGIPMVGTVLRPQPGANYIEMVDAFYDRVDRIRKDLPDDIELGIGFDKTEYIRASINEVQQTILIALGLVVTIIFLFLRDWRTTLVPVLAIPVSIVGSFFVMYLAGYSINVLTLLGLVLAIGLVVDDSIVVLENIYSKIEDGIAPLQAGFRGVKEVFFAVIATTLALVAVFMPIIFLQGLTGQLFQEFGVVLSGAVVISSFVALTLIPMAASRILQKRERPSAFYQRTEGFFRALAHGYRRSLIAFYRRRALGFAVILLCGGGIYLLYQNIPQELAPVEDRGSLRVFATGPQGATYAYMDAVMNDLYEIIQADPEVRSVISVTSPGFGASTSINSGFMRVILTKATERERSQTEIKNDLNQKLRSITRAQVFVSEEQSLAGDFRGQPVQFVIQSRNMEQLREVLPSILDKANAHPALAQAESDLKFNKPELQVRILRDKARKLNVSTRDVAETLQLALSGTRYDYFIMNGKQYEVVGQVDRHQRDSPADLKNLYTRSEEGELITLDNLIQYEESASPPQLYRFNRFTSATISATLAEGYTLSQGLDAMEAIADEELDGRFQTALDGVSKEFRESSSSLGYAFAFALLLVYLVLAAQFESFRDPFIIMLTVPLALFGSLGALYLLGETLNIFSQIGIIMLIGLVTKNAILIVEFANQRKEAGLTKHQAAVEAAASRFRPILMTSFSTILSTLPIALAVGAGSESRTAMGVAIIGGLIFAGFLTLYVIPGLYGYISSAWANRVPQLETSESSPA